MPRSESTPSALRSSLQFDALDLLRGAAAMLVLVYHVIEVGEWTSLPWSGPALVWRLGWVGVDLFLVISGFVITLSALRGSHDAAGQRDFLVRRLARIVPLHWLTLGVCLVLVRPGVMDLPAPTAAWHLATHLAFLHNLFPETHGSLNGPNWSVGLEMQFYLLVALFIPWLARVRAALLWLAALAIGLAWRQATVWALPPGEAMPAVQQVYVSQLPGTLDQFAFGIVLALAVDRGGRLVDVALRMSWWRALAYTGMAAWVLTATAEVLFAHDYWRSPAMILAWRLPLSLGFALLVAAALCLPRAGARVLAPLGYLGKISYGLYLWHLPVLLVLRQRLAVDDPVVLLAATLIVTIGIAALSWHAFESPMRHAIVKFASGSGRGRPASRPKASLAAGD